MKKILGLVLVGPLLFGGLAACSGDDTTAQATAAVTAAETPVAPVVSPTPAAAAVDDYCAQVEDFAAAARGILEDLPTGGEADLQQRAQNLQEAASELTKELIDDPSKAQQVQECTTQLQEALAG